MLHVSLLKKYIHDSKHVIDWNVIQVEPEGEFLPKPLCILDKKKISLESSHRSDKGAIEALWF